VKQRLIGYTARVVELNSNRYDDDNRLYVNGNNWNDNNNGCASGMALYLRHPYIMKTYKNIYEGIYDYKNLISAYKKARKHKTKKPDVIEFHKDYLLNLWHLSNELKNQTYIPRLLKKFIIKDPKTRVIHSSDFRDRIVHHILIMFIEPIFDKEFIYDSCANRRGKGTLFAINRFDFFKRKVAKNFTRNAYCLKADIRHYFEEVDQAILLSIIKRKVKDERVIWLIEQILANLPTSEGADASFHKLGQIGGGERLQ
jgi:retron-type reverse transcriptase